MRYESKEALLRDIRSEYDALCVQLGEIPRARWRELGVWGDGWTVCDLVAHLAEWHRMLLTWYEGGLEGVAPDMPALGYKWNELPRLNRAIWAKHRSRAPAAVMTDFEAGYVRILRIVEDLDGEQLLMPGTFAWTGKHPLTTYLGPNTASHYRFARKVLTRWLKGSVRHRAKAGP